MSRNTTSAVVPCPDRASTAAAQNVSPEDQAKAEGQTTNPNAATDAKQYDSSTAPADYAAVKAWAKAEADYTAAKAKCDGMQGDAMRTCMSDAKSARSDALAMAKTQHRLTVHRSS